MQTKLSSHRGAIVDPSAFREKRCGPWNMNHILITDIGSKNHGYSCSTFPTYVIFRHYPGCQSLKIRRKLNNFKRKREGRKDTYLLFLTLFFYSSYFIICWLWYPGYLDV